MKIGNLRNSGLDEVYRVIKEIDKIKEKLEDYTENVLNPRRGIVKSVDLVKVRPGGANLLTGVIDAKKIDVEVGDDIFKYLIGQKMNIETGEEVLITTRGVYKNQIKIPSKKVCITPNKEGIYDYLALEIKEYSKRAEPDSETKNEEPKSFLNRFFGGVFS